MPCYHPLTAYRSKAGQGANGKWPLVFRPQDGYTDLPVTVPCGRCIGCRLERSRQWAIRCVHEASLYEQNCFITLTYSPEHIHRLPAFVDPETGEVVWSLEKRDFPLFMKRLRKRFGDGIRFFHCAEYGEENLRPHHHAILFNFDFSDKKIWTVRKGIRLYTSSALSDLWPFGWSVIGSATFESCAYVARYVTKKYMGDGADEHYYGRLPEHTSMSRRPGIGRPWLDRFQRDVYPHDHVVLRNNIICKPPRYYDSIFEQENPAEMLKIKSRRRLRALKSGDNTPDRIATRERIQIIRAKKLVRPVEKIDGQAYPLLV